MTRKVRMNGIAARLFFLCTIEIIV